MYLNCIWAVFGYNGDVFELFLDSCCIFAHFWSNFAVFSCIFTVFLLYLMYLVAHHCRIITVFPLYFASFVEYFWCTKMYFCCIFAEFCCIFPRIFNVFLSKCILKVITQSSKTYSCIVNTIKVTVVLQKNGPKVLASFLAGKCTFLKSVGRFISLLFFKFITSLLTHSHSRFAP